MDVAQVFTEALQRPPSSPVVDSPSEVKSPAPPSSLGTSDADNAPEEEEEYTPPSVKNLVSNWGPRTGGSNGAAVNGASGTSRPNAISAPPLEKRKSSYEKYSAFIMPPLAEERTPVPSPAGTLKQDAAPDPALLEEEEEVEVTKAEKTTDIAVRLQEEVSIPAKEVPAPVASRPPQPKAAAKDELVRLGQ